MQYGFSAHIFDEYGDPRLLVDLACEAEAAGWDGFFLWDHIAWPGQKPLIDPWITLAAIAASTKRIRLGPMVAAPARRRPWKLARETVTLDHLSGGRVILGVGLGYHQEEEFENLGEEGNPKVRAAKLDEGLDVLTGLWSGQPFSYTGDHYQVTDACFLPPPVQQPRIPIWVAGLWPTKAPFRRAARWDGAFPGSAKPLTPDDIREIRDYIQAHRSQDGPFDIVSGSPLADKDPAEAARIIADYADAGVTWWLETTIERSPDHVRAQIRRGPPA